MIISWNIYFSASTTTTATTKYFVAVSEVGDSGMSFIFTGNQLTNFLKVQTQTTNTVIDCQNDSLWHSKGSNMDVKFGEITLTEKFLNFHISQRMVWTIISSTNFAFQQIFTDFPLKVDLAPLTWQTERNFFPTVSQI